MRKARATPHYAHWAKKLQREAPSALPTRRRVLVALTEVLIEHLAEGKIVRLGDFGAFQVSVSSEDAETEAKFNTSLIKGNKVVFRPGTDLKEMQNNLKYEKA